MYFLQLQGGLAPLTPLSRRLISSLQDFFSSPVPIPENKLCLPILILFFQALTSEVVKTIRDIIAMNPLYRYFSHLNEMVLNITHLFMHHSLFVEVEMELFFCLLQVLKSKLVYITHIRHRA